MIKISNMMARLEELKEYNKECFGAVAKHESQIRDIFDLRDRMIDRIENLVGDVSADVDATLRDDDFTIYIVEQLMYEEDCQFEELKDSVDELIDELVDDESKYDSNWDYKDAMNLKEDLEMVQDELILGNIDGYDDIYDIFDKVDNILNNY